MATANLYKYYGDDDFTAIKSPVVLDISGDLTTLAGDGFTRYGNSVSICNTNENTFSIQLSFDGSTYGDIIYIKSREVKKLTSAGLKKLKIIHDGLDTAYQCLAFAKNVGDMTFESGNSNIAIHALNDDTNELEYVHSINNRLLVSSTDFAFEVAKGSYSNIKEVTMSGYVTPVNNSWIDLVPWASTYIYPSSGIQMRAVSTSPLDTSSGTGIQQLEIHYLNSSHVEQEEILTLSGTTPVVTTATDILRINSIYTYAVGTNLKSAGTISIQNVGGTVTYSQILQNENNANQCIYTVPAGKTFIVNTIRLSCGSASSGRIGRFELQASVDPDGEVNNSGIFYTQKEMTVQDGHIAINLESPFNCPATADLKIRVIANASNSNAICTATFAGFLVTG